jgi:hypothetical protein
MAIGWMMRPGKKELLLVLIVLSFVIHLFGWSLRDTGS